MKEVKDKILKIDYYRWKDFKFIQGEDFKDLSKESKEKLRNSIINNGFIENFIVWEAKDGSVYCLDGYHRCLILKELEAEGYRVPDKFLCCYVECKDLKDAYKKVLIYSSQYAIPKAGSIKDLLDSLSIDLQDIIKETDLRVKFLGVGEVKLDLLSDKALDRLVKKEESTPAKPLEEPDIDKDIIPEEDLIEFRFGDIGAFMSVKTYDLFEKKLSSWIKKTGKREGLERFILYLLDRSDLK